MSSELSPVDRGRDPHTGSYRLFIQIQPELREANRRLAQALTAARSMTERFSKMRALLVKKPLLIEASDIRALEADIQSCNHMVQIVGTSASGVSAKIASSFSMTEHGVQMGSLRPQPSLN